MKVPSIAGGRHRHTVTLPSNFCGAKQVLGMNIKQAPGRTQKEATFQVRLVRAAAALRATLALAPDDLLRDLVYRRLWLSVLTSSFGAQVMVLALPLTAAVTLHASPTQMGALTE